MVDDIDGDPSEICFYKANIEVKITRNPNKKPILTMTEKLERVHIDLWGPAPDISFQENWYMWIANNQATGQVWTEYCPNKKELLQAIWN